MINTQRKIYKLVNYLLGIVLCLLTSGCSQVIELYSPEELIKLRDNNSNYATLYVGDRSHLMVDGKFVYWKIRKNPYHSYSGFAAEGHDAVHVRILPGLHKLEWSLPETEYNPAYKGSCDLDVKSNTEYHICYACEAKTLRRFSYEVQYNTIDTFTWISETKPAIIGIYFMPVCGKVPEKPTGGNCLIHHSWP